MKPDKQRLSLCETQVHQVRTAIGQIYLRAESLLIAHYGSLWECCEGPMSRCIVLHDRQSALRNQAHLHRNGVVPGQHNNIYGKLVRPMASPQEFKRKLTVQVAIRGSMEMAASDLTS